MYVLTARTKVHCQVEEDKMIEDASVNDDNYELYMLKMKNLRLKTKNLGLKTKNLGLRRKNLGMMRSLITMERMKMGVKQGPAHSRMQNQLIVHKA